MYKLQFCTFIFAVLLQFGRHRFSIANNEILAIWQSFVVFSPYFSDIKLQRYCGHDFDLSTFSHAMLKARMLTAHASYHVTYRKGVENNYIFGITDPNMAIHYDIFTGLRWRIRGVYFWDPLMLKVKSSENFCKSEKEKKTKFWRFSGSGGQGLEKVLIFSFYCKRHIYTWIHVV